MNLPSNGARIPVATWPVDFRRGHDRPAAPAWNERRRDPFTGTAFVFRSRRADRPKLSYWDGTGPVMVHRRIEERRFVRPPIADGVMEVCPARFEAPFSGLYRRRIRAVSARAPTIAQWGAKKSRK